MIAVPRVRSNAEARRQLHDLAARRADLARSERLANALRECDASCGVGARQDEREFLAAPATRAVDLADDVLHRLCEHAQRTIAGRVAVAVVDRLEPVQVGEHEADSSVEALRT